MLTAYADAWARGEPEQAWAYYADDVRMRLPGRGNLAGAYAGRDAVIGAIQALLDRTDGTPVKVEVIDRLVSPTRIAMVLREVVTRVDEQLELRRVNVYEVRDDHIASIDIFEADQYDVDEFFG